MVDKKIHKKNKRFVRLKRKSKISEAEYSVTKNSDEDGVLSFQSDLKKTEYFSHGQQQVFEHEAI